MKAQLEKSRIQHNFNQTKSGPDHLHMYASNLADDARMAYEYGLTSTPISNDFSFIDQRISPIQYYPTQNPFINRSYSMPQNTVQYLPMLSVQQENQYDHSSVNSQQGLADKIQSVRHLWETEFNQQSPYR